MLLAVYAASGQAAGAAKNSIRFPTLPLLSHPSLIFLVQVRIKELRRSLCLFRDSVNDLVNTENANAVLHW